MIVKDLGQTDFNDLMDCFLESFENYFVNMPTDRVYYRQRWEMAKVDYAYSYGMFDQDRLVGFILTAIDTRNGKRTAFNAGTGVIPAYRGKKIVRRIYEVALKAFKQIGIEKCALEVIVENTKAIRAYESVGMAIDKTYKSYKGEINPAWDKTVSLRQLSLQEVDWDALPQQSYYAWDNQKENIRHSLYRFFQVLHHREVESFFVIHPDNGYLAQHDLVEHEDGAWDRLFKGINQISSSIRVMNVDEVLEDKIKALDAVGLENYVNQYEMSMTL